MPDDIATLAIRIESLEVAAAERRLGDLSRAGGVAEKQVKGLAISSKAAMVAIGALGLATAALGAAANASVRSWLEYDKAIKEVRSITGQSREEFAHFRTEVLEVASAIGVDATMAARGLYEALSAGIPKENAIEFLKIASKTAVAGVTEVNVAVDGLTTVINAFKIPVSQAEDIANKFLQTVNDGKTTFPQLAKNISDAAIPMAALGGTFEELLAQISLLTAQGVPTSQAVTMVKASVNALMTPSKEMADVMEQLHIKSGRAMAAQYGFAGSIAKITETLNGNDAALFGAMRSSEAFSLVLANAGKNANQLATFQENLNKSTGNVERAAATNADTLATSITKLKSAATGLVETFESSSGAIAEFAKGLEGAALLIDKVSKAYNNRTLSAGGVQAMNDAAAGGLVAEKGLRKQLVELTELEKVLQSRRQRGESLTELGSKNGGFDLMGFEGRLPLTSALHNTQNEIETLKQAYDKLAPSTIAQGNAFRNLADAQSDLNATGGAGVLPEKGEIALAQAQSALDLEIQKQERVVIAAKWQEDNNAAALKSETERSLAAQVAYETGKKTQAEKEDYDKENIALAERLGKTVRQTKEEEIARLEKLKDQKDVTAEQLAFGEAAIANLKEELSLLDEKGNRIPTARAVHESSSSGAMTPKASAIADEMTPIFEAPTRNQFEELAKQEAEVIKSYNKRKIEILKITGITEKERSSLIYNSNRQLKDAAVHFDKERNEAMLTQTGELYGNLATIAGVFGKKGHKAAQALGIAQATMSTYQAANKALADIAPPYSYVAAAAAVAAGMANVAKIASTPYAGAFATGGIVGGNSFSGDNLTASVNSGEMILNGGQQRNLFNMANGKQAPGGNANVEVTIINNTGEKVTQRENQIGDRKMVEFIIGQASDKVAGDIQKGGTRVSKAFEGTYNLGRGGK